MNKEMYNLTSEGIRDLLKIGARETAKVAMERDYLIKFAMAVEILPRLERAGVVQFPMGMEMHKKATKMAEKPIEELQKLAYLAKHAPATPTHGVKEATENSKIASAKESETLTQAFIGIMG